MADAEHATIELWEALCRNCRHWTLLEVSADVEGRDIGRCAVWEGTYPPEDHFCAEHPLIVTTRQAHRVIVDERIRASNAAAGLDQ